MRSWKPLQKGDLVDLLAPGYPVEKERIEAGVHILKTWGLRVRQAPDLIKPFHFHAQTDEKRLASLLKILAARDSQAAWCVRGGYGSNRLIPGLLKNRVIQVPKIFIGISDVTSLHLFLNQKWKWKTLHGPLLDRLGAGTLPPEYLEELRSLLFGESKEVLFEDLQPMNKSALKKQKITGIVTGGNLTVLQSALATKLQPRLDGKILFLEDTGERGYRVDRMLEQFKQAGLFHKCAAVVFGPFLGGSEPRKEGFSFIPFALERFAEGISVPVWQGIEVGHGERQRCLPLGSPATLQNKILRVHSGVV